MTEDKLIVDFPFGDITIRLTPDIASGTIARRVVQIADFEIKIKFSIRGYMVEMKESNASCAW